MAITTRDGLIAAQAAAQHVRHFKTALRTTVANFWFSLFDIAGDPGAGTLAGSSTAAGVVPTDATAGCPVLNAFTGANTGYLSRVEFSNTVACRMALYDMVWKGGAYAFNAAQALSAQPSYSARMPGGDYTGTEIWIEAVTAFTGIPSFAITYTDQDGNAGALTGTQSAGVALTVGRMMKMPFAAGDDGVQKIENVTATVATVGTFNVLVMRKLWEGRIRVANDQVVHGPDLVGLPQLFTDSALVLLVNADGTSSGLPECVFDVING